MAIAPKTFEPQTLAAGDTISFLKALADYRVDAGWALEYELSGPVNYEFTSTANGNSHQLTVAAAVTAAWLPGEYELSGFAVNAGTDERVQIYKAQLVVTPNVAAGQVAAKSHAQKMIELIEPVMLGKAQHDILESDIEGARIKRLAPKDLREEYNYWVTIRKAELDAQRTAQGLGNKNKILPRFQITGGFNVPISSGWPFQ